MESGNKTLQALTQGVGEELSDGMVLARELVGGIDGRESHCSTGIHWHYDLEFLYSDTDDCVYLVNGTAVELKKGQTLFINSCRLHRRVTRRKNDGRLVLVRIDPKLIAQASSLGKNLCDRKFSFNAPDFLILDGSEDWHSEVAGLVQSMPEHVDGQCDRPLLPIITALRLVDAVSRRLPDVEPSENRSIQERMTYLFILDYIRGHYSEKIRTEDLAEAGNTSRAKVFRLFERYAGCSPNEYIVKYRLEKSKELLCDTELSIFEVSELCGFNTPSYFTSVFRHDTGVTPREYRAGVQSDEAQDSHNSP